MSESRFDDIFSAASKFTPVDDQPKPTAAVREASPAVESRDTPPKQRQRKTKTQPKSPTASGRKNSSRANDFWSNFDSKDDRIRLNVDISNSLNDRLCAKAKKLGQPKAELVRRLIEWALDEDDE
jgi:hypothetical protein